MKLFEVQDSGSLLLILKNYRDQADGKNNSLTLKFDALKKQFNLDDYGLSDAERFKQWLEKTPGAKSVIDTVGIPDIKEPNPQVSFKTDKPGKVDGQPKSNPRTPTVSSMASSAAKQSLGQNL